MPDPTVHTMNLWWVVTLGTAIALALALGFVLSVYYSERTQRNLERKSEQRYSELFHNINDLVYIHSPEGIIQEINKSVMTLLRLPRESIIGNSIEDFLPTGYKQYLRRYLAEACEADPLGEITGLFPLGHAPLAHPNNSKDLIILEYRSRVILDRAGKVTAVWGIARDQTKRILQEKSLRKSSRKIEDLYRESERTRAELSNLSQKMMQLQEEDRLRISRELHDEVGQTLTAISTNLEVVKQDLPADQLNILARLSESQTLAKEVTQCIRRVIRELRPVAIDELGLLPSLRKYIAEFESRSGIHVIFRYDPIEEDLSLNEKITIYRIVQESLTNIARHSGATEANISLLERGEIKNDVDATDILTSLEITDNGRGMTSSGSLEREEEEESNELVSQASTGLQSGIGNDGDGDRTPARGIGLLGIQERVKLLSGTFQIGSSPHGGTRISITLPRAREV